MAKHSGRKFCRSLKIAFLFLSLSLFLQSYGRTQQASDPNIAPYIEKLKDKDEGNRREAIRELKRIGSPAVPALIEVLKDKDEQVRLHAAAALGNIGGEAKAAVPALMEALQDDRDASVRGASAAALANIGAEAKAEAKEAVPVLMKALEDKDNEVRFYAAAALWNIGTQAKAAVPALVKALKEDTHNQVRYCAAAALGNIGTEALAAVPALVEALQDTDASVRSHAVEGLGAIATDFQDKADTLSPSNLEQVISTFEKALRVLEKSKAQFKAEDIALVRKPLLALQAEREKKNFWLKRIIKYPLVLVAPIYGLVLLGIFRHNPLWILRMSNKVKLLKDLSLPREYEWIKDILSALLLVNFFKYYPRVLDAWVAAHIDTVREEFEQKTTVSDRSYYVPIPVVLDGNTVANFTGKDLRTTFAKKQGRLLIWGEGGSGKTSLACQVARWAMSDKEVERLCEHLMLPVMIEEDLNKPLIEAIRGQVQDLSEEVEPISRELLEALLRHRRILVIVDRFSEMSEATRKEIAPDLSDFPVNALVVTSRVEETLGRVNRTTIKPLRIEGNRLLSFMEAYLTQRAKRDLFTDSEFVDACRRLSAMVGERNITVLLAKLYAEQMINAKTGAAVGDLPENIPDLMLRYLNELNKGVPENHLDDRTVHQDAKALAWECLKQTYRPAPALRNAAIAALGGDNAEVRLEYLESRLHLIQTIGAGKDKIRFALDPLAEYLAGLHLVDLYSQNENLWREFLAQADSFFTPPAPPKPGGGSEPEAPKAIHGFLLAVLDCCLANGLEVKVPNFVPEELTKRVSLDVEAVGRSPI